MQSKNQSIKDLLLDGIIQQQSLRNETQNRNSDIFYNESEDDFE